MSTNTIPLRTSQSFVNWFSICYFACAIGMFIYLWANTPVIADLWTSLLDFAFNIMYVVIGALLWPGTLLAMLVMCFY
ncbi:hypothetical protein [Turicimonas muris]|uniref:hypothetical protein n=1 Tax=Turicimonas muris TaxID=1796652 RepID=UPI0026EB9313|nr:hypothetical protein [Turicimonas muris]